MLLMIMIMMELFESFFVQLFLFSASRCRKDHGDSVGAWQHLAAVPGTRGSSYYIAVGIPLQEANMAFYKVGRCFFWPFPTGYHTG